MAYERNNEFEQLKQAIFEAQDFSGSVAEIEALKQAVMDYQNNPAVADKNKLDDSFLSFDKLYFGEKNEKTGAKTCIVNIGGSLTCYECQNGFCNLQKAIRGKKGRNSEKIRCYGLRNDNRLPYQVLTSINNYIVFNTLSTNDLIKQIRTFILKNGSYYLRFNEKGSFYGLNSFLKCDDIAKALKSYVISYSYTSNKALFDKVEKTCFMRLNLSLGLAELSEIEIKDYKQTIIIKNDLDSITEAINDDRLQFCLSDCSNCSKCKDKDNKLITAFIEHSPTAEYSIEDVYSLVQLNKLSREAMIKNMAFVSSNLL